MSSSSIAFLDSGVGGLPYLKKIRDLRSDLTYIYFADGGNFPYGTKESGKLIEILLKRVDSLLTSYKPEMIVIACNTATVTALDILRDNFSIPFVGVVPAVKPAAQQSLNKRIGILATEGTVKGPYMDWLEKSFASDCLVFREAAGDIVDLVENRLFSSSEKDKQQLISRAVTALSKENVDTIVLGCTHFTYVQDLISGLVSHEINVIDSRDGVAQQILRMIDAHQIQPGNSSESCLIHSGNESDTQRYRQFSNYFQLEYRGLFPCQS